MATSKQASLRLSSEADLQAFKTFKETHCSGMTNSQVLNQLLDLGTSHYLGTSLGTNIVTNLGSKVVTTEMLDTRLVTELEPMQKFDEQCYENFKKLQERFNKLEAFVYDD